VAGRGVLLCFPIASGASLSRTSPEGGAYGWSPTRSSQTPTAVDPQPHTAATTDAIEVSGTLIDVLPNAFLRVRLENDQTVLAHAAGKMRKFFIKIIQGDTVTVQLSPYDLSRGRITFRQR